MGVYTPVVRTNKKHQSQRLWCKRFYALHTAPLGKPKAEIGTEYPDLMRGLSPVLSAKPSPLLRVAALLRQSERTYTLQCRFCVGDFHPVPLYFAQKSAKPCSEICKYSFLSKFTFTVKLNINHLLRFVNTLSQKRQLWNTPA